MNLKSINYEAEPVSVRRISLKGRAKVLLAFFMAVAMLAPAAVGSQSARADEGMWLVNAISRSLERKMKDRGLKIDAGMIYDEDSASLSDAIVSLDFGCTASIISKSGLLITNHHCAFSDLHDLSTPEHNYLEDGFWAFEAKDEIPIKGKNAYILHKIIDVTDEYKEVVDSLIALHQGHGSRRSSYMLEKRYSNKYPGYDVSASSFWGGEKWYLAVYRKYTDMRLVGAPPVSVASFGGDIDNWEWPQQKCDFALYRIYTAPDGSPADYSKDNVPLVPSNSLVISTDGALYGDYSMVIGFPGRTSRYSSSSEVRRATDIENPIVARLEGEQMGIIGEAMNRDPIVRLKYSDYYFSLSNVQELRKDEASCCRRFDVVNAKCSQEKAYSSEFGNLMDSIRFIYGSTDSIEKQVVYFRETVVRGTRIVALANRIVNSIDRRLPGDKEVIVAKSFKDRNPIEEAKADYDLPLEESLFRLALKTFVAHVDSCFWGEFVRAEYDKFGGSVERMGDDIWNNSTFTDWNRLEKTINTPHTVAFFNSDPLLMFFRSTNMLKFNDARAEEDDGVDLYYCERSYTRRLYRRQIADGKDIYPDANSTMRVSYGNVTDLRPRDGVICSWRSTSAGLLQKYDSTKYEYALKPDFIKLVRSNSWGPYMDNDGTMHLNFLTNNDITGGNSGSPVLDGYGRLIGLAFDGNKESQASNFYYQPGYDDCVCVDIRYVLWVLDRYAHFHRILNELTFE